MIESVCTVLNDGRIYLDMTGTTYKFTELDVYLDITNISHLGKYMVS